MRITSISRSNCIRVGVALALAGASFTAAASGGNVNASMSVSGSLAAACELSGTPAINFSPLAALASGSDATGDTGSSLNVACSAGLSPSFYVAGTRSLSSGGVTPILIPFNLSLTAGAASNDLASTTGTSLSITQDGTAQTVTVYGRVLVANSQGKPNNTYSTNLTVNVDY